MVSCPLCALEGIQIVKAAVLGLGYVGTVTAAALASRGHDVCGADIDASKVEMIASGRSPVIEPGLDELVAAAVSSGSLRTSTDVAEAVRGADVSLVCVGTPSAPGGGTDLRYVMRAVEDIAQALRDTPTPKDFHSVVVRSTVPPAPSTTWWRRPSSGRSGRPESHTAPQCALSSSERDLESPTSSIRPSPSSARAASLWQVP